MRRLALLAFFLVAACGPINSAQAHVISLAYKAGDTYGYRFHMVLKYTIGAQGLSMPLDVDLAVTEKLTVKSVDSSGVADVSVAMSYMSVKTTVNGTTNGTTTTTPTSLDMKIAPDGHIVSINGSAFGDSVFPGVSGSQGGLVTAILPDGPVKPGDKWTKSFDQPNPFGSGSSHVTSDSTYVSDENVGTTSTALVESKLNTALDMSIDMSSMMGQAGTPMLPPTGAATGVQGIAVKGTSTSDVNSWIDTGARRVVKTHSTGSVDATLTVNMAAGSTTPGLVGPITFKGTQTLDMTPA